LTAYVLTVEAEADLRHIIRYTRKQRRYIGSLNVELPTLQPGKVLLRI